MTVMPSTAFQLLQTGQLTHRTDLSDPVLRMPLTGVAETTPCRIRVSVKLTAVRPGYPKWTVSIVALNQLNFHVSETHILKGAESR
jgi:hypothetical protein